MKPCCRFSLLCLGSFLAFAVSTGHIRASSVTVVLESVAPDPARVDDVVSAGATAQFTGAGADQQQLTLDGAQIEYRWKWEYLSDGGVSSTIPPLDSQDPPWTVWDLANTSSAEGGFTALGYKLVKVTVQARVVNAQEQYRGPVVEAGDQADLTVAGVEYVHVKRAGSAGEYSATTTIAAGGYDSDGHKALLEVKLAPVPLGEYCLTFPLTLSGADGDIRGGDNVDARLTIGGELALEGNGTTQMTFSSADGTCTGGLRSSNVLRTCTVECGGAAASVVFAWDTDSDLEAEYPETYTMGVCFPVAVTIRLGDEPIVGHQLKFFASKVQGRRIPEGGGWVEFTEETTASAPDALSQYAQFFDDDQQGGDGVVTDSPSGSGIYTAYRLVHESDVWYVDNVWFDVVDARVYHP